MKERELTTKKNKFMMNFNNILGALHHKVNHLMEEEVDENQAFVDIIRIAHDEWKSAEVFFENVTEPDLIDHAIYKMEAAKSRYIYLLKKAKEEGIKVNLS
ncbi:DUF2508 family protein [Alkaliphilus serpentinus]|nr:DUF2508 family protein [Alkaliphilus serpentinus]